MSAGKSVILTPRADNRLVWREATCALENHGHTVTVRDEKELSSQELARILTLPPERSGLPEHPNLFFSINFLGLDKFGEIFSVLHGKGIPVAVWCVDNVWNLLSGLRSDFWKELHLFVTDPSFIPGLRAHGAKHVTYLPLATSPATFFPSPNDADAPITLHPLVFVGRSAFPDKERFFVGQHLPENFLHAAARTMERGGRPDFFWWLDTLGSQDAPLWPGSLARRVSLGAEKMSLAWRTAWLQAAAPLGLAIYGDQGWQNCFPLDTKRALALLPPVDYYTDLRKIYATAPFSLNMVSFLLPHGLNQRHFDIWAAGGFCLTDNSPGLNLFPRELTGPITCNTPEDIPDTVAYFDKNPKDKQRVAETWKEHILAEHTYAHRMRLMTKSIFS
jgi:Uncharacterized protein conserved in bacteria